MFSTMIIMTNLEELLPEVGVEPPVEDGVADTGGERDTVTNAQDEVVHLNKHLVTHHSFIMLVLAFDDHHSQSNHHHHHQSAARIFIF